RNQIGIKQNNLRRQNMSVRRIHHFMSDRRLAKRVTKRFTTVSQPRLTSLPPRMRNSMPTKVQSGMVAKPAMALEKNTSMGAETRQKSSLSRVPPQLRS